MTAPSGGVSFPFSTIGARNGSFSFNWPLSGFVEGFLGLDALLFAGALAFGNVSDGKAAVFEGEDSVFFALFLVDDPFLGDLRFIGALRTVAFTLAPSSTGSLETFFRL